MESPRYGHSNMMDLIEDLRLHEIYKRIPECWYELSLVNKSTRRDIARVYHLYGEPPTPTPWYYPDPKAVSEQEALVNQGRWYELVHSDMDPNKIMSHAAEHNRMDIVQLMISKGADRWNYSMAKASGAGHIPIVQFMISKGANNWDESMAWASGGGHTSIIELMLARGAGNWNWAMVCASAGGHLDIVQYMIKRGAKRWKQAIDAARRGGHSSVVKLIEQKRKEHELMVEKLMKKCIPERRW